MITFARDECPRCRRTADIRIFAESVLGPEIVVCTGCGTTFATRLTEWADMTKSGRWRFWVMTIPALAFGAVAGPLCVRAMYEAWHHPLWFRFTLEGPGDHIGLIYGVGLMLSIQLQRVLGSLWRTRRRPRQPYYPLLFNFQLGIFPKVIALFVLPPILVFVLRRLVGPW